MTHAPTPEEAANLLQRGSALTTAVGHADNGRRKIYALWAAVLPVAMVWFDLVERSGIAALVMIPFVLAGVAGTMFIIREQQVNDLEAMRSYVVVMGVFALTWALLMALVGPRLGESYSFGWTLTGLLGSLVFIAGYLWDRTR